MSIIPALAGVARRLEWCAPERGSSRVIGLSRCAEGGDAWLDQGDQCVMRLVVALFGAALDKDVCARTVLAQRLSAPLAQPEPLLLLPVPVLA